MLRACYVQGYGAAQQLVKGLYAVPLPNWLATWPREQLLFLTLADYARDTRATLARVLAHVRLARPSEAAWATVLREAPTNKAKVQATMREDTRALLREFYRPFNERLAGMLGDEVYLKWNE